MKNPIHPTVIALLLAVSRLPAATLYVTQAGTNPTRPYTNWVTAATNLQQAVDVAAAGDVVLVTNGIYAGGVAVTNALTLLSVNGPQVTVLDGGGTNQCIALTDGASLTGFTLTNGTGGIVCASTNALVTHCVIADCHGGYFSGVNGGTLYNCTLVGNSAEGWWDTDSYVPGQGGGAKGSTLHNCTLTGNSAPGGCGGGADACTLYNCTVTGNADGGACACTLYNCIVYFNTAAAGGANYDANSVLLHCCTTPLPTNGLGNLAANPQLAGASHLSVGSPCRGAGAAAYATGADIDGETWNNPPAIGCDEYHEGAVTGPLTVDLTASHTQVAVGYPVVLTALIEGRTTDSLWDFGDGDIAINQPFVTHRWMQAGDYPVRLWAVNETHESGVNATVTIHAVAHPFYVAATGNNPQPPYASWSTAATNIQAAVDAAVVGALVLVTNGVYAGGVTVTDSLALCSVNGPRYTVINGGGTNRCVALADGAGLTGFTLTNGMAPAGGGAWCASGNAFLTNCTLTGNTATHYGGGGAFGGTLYNCTFTGNSAGSGGGAASSTLHHCTLTGNSATDVYGVGGGAYACWLYDCTLTDNSAACRGGGVSGGTLYRCVLTGNTAESDGGGSDAWTTFYNCTLTDNSAPNGGGSYGGVFYNCLLTDNSALPNAHGYGGYGGAGYGSTLYNCTLSGNAAVSGGGVYGDVYSPALLYNCIVYFNRAPSGANCSPSSTVTCCCTTPLPTNGVGNITNAPRFIDYTNGNLRLQTNSPCINAGNNAYVTTTIDLDGDPRIEGGAVDLGAYEYQTPTSVISYAWLQYYGFPSDGSADFIDSDGDGLNNYQEWLCGTDPTDPLSVLRLVSATPTGTNATVAWRSEAGVNYFLERSANLAAPFTPLAAGIVGQAGTTSYADTNATGAGPFFYRVGVQAP